MECNIISQNDDVDLCLKTITFRKIRHGSLLTTMDEFVQGLKFKKLIFTPIPFLLCQMKYISSVN